MNADTRDVSKICSDIADIKRDLSDIRRDVTEQKKLITGDGNGIPGVWPTVKTHEKRIDAIEVAEIERKTREKMWKFVIGLVGIDIISRIVSIFI